MQPQRARGLLVCGMAWCLVLAGCGQTDGTASPHVVATPPGASDRGESIAIPGAGDGLIWGDGPYGLVLLHDRTHTAEDWAAVAPSFADDRMTVVALTEATGPALREAIAWLRGRGVARAAVLAAGDAARAVAGLGASDPRLIDQAIVVSPPAGLNWRAEFPKLFVASTEEPADAAAREAADQAAGTWNVLLELPGAGTGQALFANATRDVLMTALLRRLDERR